MAIVQHNFPAPTEGETVVVKNKTKCPGTRRSAGGGEQGADDRVINPPILPLLNNVEDERHVSNPLRRDWLRNREPEKLDTLGWVVERNVSPLPHHRSSAERKRLMRVKLSVSGCNRPVQALTARRRRKPTLCKPPLADRTGFHLVK
ncbi:CXE carboxylesterase [Anopheles sinensis]|uniref:CXE carboxylesterase n=1 Tax=Anopheles sinensis TaxID=74873 RepID=A0A084WR23_ANOSI|nr:CXE carboxylesterase [Anopheles sinensis]